MTDRITGKIIPKNNRTVKIYSDFYTDDNSNSSDNGSVIVDPTNPPTKLSPNIIYDYGTITNITFPPLENSEESGNVYCWFF